jgi:lysophospholipase L1-like esterase
LHVHRATLSFWTLLDTSRRFAWIAIVVSAVLFGGCQGRDTDATPTSPSPATPSPGAPVRYAALGASDATGVGASVVCIPFTACEMGTGYVPVLVRQLRATREVTLLNLGIPGAVLSPTIYEIARRFGRDVPASFVDREMPFVPGDSTLVTIFGGANDVNALGDAIERGAAGGDLRGYIDAQVRAFGADYDRLVRGVRDRAPGALILILNVPNMAALPYTANYSQQRRQVLQYISTGFSREANRQAGSGVIVIDLMCDGQVYDRSRFASDGFHPNDSGYAYLADRLLAVVNGAPSSTASACGPMTVVSPL